MTQSTRTRKGAPWLKPVLLQAAKMASNNANAF